MSTPLSLTDDQILDTPIADGVGIIPCPDPECRLIHLMLIDEDGEPIAQCTIDPEMFEVLRAAMAKIDAN